MKSSMSNSDVTHSAPRPAAEQAQHAYVKFDKNYSDANNQAINFVKKLLSKDRLSDDLKNVQNV